MHPSEICAPALLRMGELSFFVIADAKCFHDHILDLVADRAEAEKQTRINNWKARIADDDRSCIAWVKRRGDRGAPVPPPRPAQAARLEQTAVHPLHILNKSVETWSEEWRTKPIDRAAFANMLVAVPRPSPVVLPSPTAEEFRKQASNMQHRAPGLDQWQAEDMLKLPTVWWEGLTSIWRCLLRGHHAPDAWKGVHVRLLDKQDAGDTRPIGLTSLAWRVGSRWLVGALRPWMSQWLDATTYGGVYDSSVHDVHQFVNFVNDGQTVFVSQDLSRFFDSVNHSLMDDMLEHFNMPTSVRRLLQDVYSGGWRFMSYKGHTHPEMLWPERGLIQGCRLSPLLAAGFMRIWSAVVVLPNTITATSFVDDRLFWDRSGRLPCLIDAKRRSDSFDHAAAFQCRAKKCSVAAAPDSHGDIIADALGYECTSQLGILGLNHSMGKPKEVGLLKAVDCKVRGRLKGISVLPRPSRQRRKLIQQLVAPVMHWAAGIVRWDAPAFAMWRHETCRAVLGRGLTDTPVALSLEVLGWKYDPVAVAAECTLRAIIRHQARLPRWLEMIDLDFAVQKVAGFVTCCT